jgi:hypothetical protein
MPAKSAAQYRFMQMIAHNKKPTKGGGPGPSPAVAKEFIEKTSPEQRKRFAKMGKKR